MIKDDRLVQLTLACYRGVYAVTNHDGKHVQERLFEYALHDGTVVWGNTAAFYLEAAAALGLERHEYGYDNVHVILREHGERVFAAGTREPTGMWAGKHRPQAAQEWFGVAAPGRQVVPSLTPAIAQADIDGAVRQHGVAAVVRACFAGLRPDGALHFHLDGDGCASETDVAVRFDLTARAVRRILRDRLPGHYLQELAPARGDRAD